MPTYSNGFGSGIGDTETAPEVPKDPGLPPTPPAEGPAEAEHVSPGGGV
jgi:hypothetical protein